MDIFADCTLTMQMPLDDLMSNTVRSLESLSVFHGETTRGLPLNFSNSVSNRRLSDTPKLTARPKQSHWCGSCGARCTARGLGVVIYDALAQCRDVTRARSVHDHGRDVYGLEVRFPLTQLIYP